MSNGLLLPEEKEFQRQYRLSSWWIDHRESLKRLGYGIFIACDALLILFGSYHLADAFLISAPEERRALLEMASYGHADLRAYTQANAARDLDPGSVTVIPAGEGKYDLYAEVTNPNADWWAEYRYQFQWNGGETEIVDAVVLPDESHPSPAFSVVAESAPRSAKLVVSDVVWHRVDRHITGDYTKWHADHMDLLIENVAFTTEQLTNSFSRVTFDVTNRTAYSYYGVEFTILLLRGSTVVGVNQTTLSSLDAGKKETVVVNWFGPAPAVGKVEVIPTIPIFDLSHYKPLAGELQNDTRTRVFPNAIR